MIGRAGSARGRRDGRERRVPREDRERGTALIEFSWLAILLMVPLIYILISVFDVQKAAYGATAATRAAGRAFVLAPSVGAAQERARQAADVALRDQGLTLAEVGGIDITCDRGCLQPGSSVTIVIDTQVILPLAPEALGSARPSIHVRSAHTTPYGTYREGKS